MTIEFPWLLLGMLALPVMVWCHRRGPIHGTVPFSALFLFDKEQQISSTTPSALFMRGLLWARLIAVSLCVAAAVGLGFTTENGTLVLVTGPVEPSEDWAPPITYVRAGYPPSLVDELDSVLPVDAAANFEAALQFGRRLSPRGRLVLASSPRSSQSVVKSAGVALANHEIIVSVTGPTSSPVSLVTQGGVYPLKRRGTDWYLRGVLPAGVADIVADGGVQTSLCIPDASPLKVANTGWPPAVMAVLKVMPNVKFVPVDEATWRVGRERSKEVGWLAFSEFSTTFVFAESPNEGTAPLWFEDDLPDPQAVVRRWRAIDEPGNIIMRAAGRAVADMRDGLEGRNRRFGFKPVDTDLIQTAAWPVLFFDAIEDDRRARTRCRTHRAGQDLTILTRDDVVVEYGDGRTIKVPAVNGRAVVTGLDTAGRVRLASSGRQAEVVVTPNDSSDATATLEGTADPVSGQVSRTLWLTFACGGVLLVGFIGGWRRLWYGLAVIILLLAYVPGTVGQLGKAPVILAVDLSGSMPSQSTNVLVQNLERQLGQAVAHRVEGAERVRRIASAGEPVGRTAGHTRFGPIIDTATELAGPSGVIVLVSDGRASDGVVAAPVPVFTVPVVTDLPDARVVRGQAVRAGNRVFVQVEVACDIASKGTVEIGTLSRPVEMNPDEVVVVNGILPGTAPHVLEVSVAVDNDRIEENNKLPILVRGQDKPVAVVLGQSGEEWARQAGFSVKPYSPSSVLEDGADIGRARAMLIVDQPAASLSKLFTSRLERWVRAGGMLLLAGRQRAFGPGGWSAHPMDSLSPLRARPDDSNESPLGVIALLDRSGSVSQEAGGVGLDVLGDLAARLGRGLRKKDKISIVAFGGGVETLLPLTEVDRLQDGMVPVPTRALGGTLLGPALNHAKKRLRASGLTRGRIVVMSDGRFADNDSQLALDERPSDDSLQIFGLLLGQDVERKPLCELAERTGGSCVELSNLEARTTLDTSTLLLGESLSRGAGRVTPTDAWSARIGGLAPNVESRVQVGARDEARVLANVDGVPLLAEWQIGRGRVMALATDDWRLTEAQWIALWAPALAPRQGGPRLSIQGDELMIETRPSLPPPDGFVTIRSPAGESERQRWIPVGPGRARVPLPQGLHQLLDVETQTDDGISAARLVRGHSEEVIETGSYPALLKLQAEITGARMLSGPNDVRAILDARGRRGRFPWAAIAAIVAVVLLILDALHWAGLLRQQTPRA